MIQANINTIEQGNIYKFDHVIITKHLFWSIIVFNRADLYILISLSMHEDPKPKFW